MPDDRAKSTTHPRQAASVPSPLVPSTEDEFIEALYEALAVIRPDMYDGEYRLEATPTNLIVQLPKRFGPRNRHLLEQLLWLADNVEQFPDVLKALRKERRVFGSALLLRVRDRIRDSAPPQKNEELYRVVADIRCWCERRLRKTPPPFARGFDDPCVEENARLPLELIPSLDLESGDWVLARDAGSSLNALRSARYRGDSEYEIGAEGRKKPVSGIQTDGWIWRAERPGSRNIWYLKFTPSSKQPAHPISEA